MKRKNSKSSEQPQSPRRDRSRQKGPREDEGEESEGDNNQAYIEQNQQSFDSRDPLDSSQRIACQLRSIFLKFWGSVKHEKGFVFTKQQRQKMKNEQKKILKKNKNYICIEWKQQCEWDQEEQNRKISKIFDKEQLDLPQATINLLRDIFFKTSFLFGSETTGQLYMLLMGIVKIYLNDGHNQDKKAIVHQYMEMLMKGNEFKFFNYQFSKHFKLSEDNEANLAIYKNLGEEVAFVIQPILKLQ